MSLLICPSIFFTARQGKSLKQLYNNKKSERIEAKNNEYSTKKFFLQTTFFHRGKTNISNLNYLKNIYKCNQHLSYFERKQIY